MTEGAKVVAYAVLFVVHVLLAALWASDAREAVMLAVIAVLAMTVVYLLPDRLPETRDRYDWPDGS